ncbi:MAG: glycosyltransferase [Bacteroides sp.]|nr:glycosyltransferase [Bacteroides sp.]
MIARNAQEYIAGAIESVLNQSYSDFELIIIDDGSTDETSQVVRSYSDSRIRFIESNHDYIANLNTGLRLCKGDYIARLDADDFYHTDKLKIQLKRMQQFPEVDICATFGSLVELGKPSKAMYDHCIYNRIYSPLQALLKKNFIIHSSVLLKRSFIEENQCEYSGKYPYCEDYALWFEIAKKGGQFYVEPQVLTGIVKHREQVTATKAAAMRVNSINLRINILRYLIESKGIAIELSWIDSIRDYIVLNNLDPEILFNFFNELLAPCFNGRGETIG